MCIITPTVLTAASVGLAAAGTATTVVSAHNQANASKEAEAQRKKAMELDARRRSMEILRNQQRARALALTNATGQGAAEGSGLQGGYGQIAGATNDNLLGISQNLQIGRNIFDANMRATEAGAWMATGQGLSSLGSSLMQASGNLNNVFGGPKTQGVTPMADSTSYYKPANFFGIGRTPY